MAPKTNEPAPAPKEEPKVEEPKKEEAPKEEPKANEDEPEKETVTMSREELDKLIDDKIKANQGKVREDALRAQLKANTDKYSDEELQSMPESLLQKLVDDLPKPFFMGAGGGEVPKANDAEEPLRMPSLCPPKPAEPAANE